MICTHKTSIEIKLEGDLVASDNINDLWPDQCDKVDKQWADWFAVEYSTNISLTGSPDAVVNGLGKRWWTKMALGTLPGDKVR